MDKRIHLYIDNQMDEQEKKAFEKELLENKQLNEEYKKMSALLELAQKQYQPLRAPQNITDKIMQTIIAREKTALLRAILSVAAGIIIFLLIGRGIFMYKHAENNLIDVTFRVSIPDAKKVYLMGSFNKWGERKDELKRLNNGLFTLTLKLKPGIYQYVYKVDDNRIVPDPDAKLYTEDGFGQKNAILIVKSTRNS